MVKNYFKGNISQQLDRGYSIYQDPQKQDLIRTSADIPMNIGLLGRALYP